MNVCKQAPLHWGVKDRRLELVNKSQTIVFEPSCIWCKDENHSGNWTRVDKDVSRSVWDCWREEDRPDYTSALLRTGKTTNICSPFLPTMTLHHPCCWPVAHPPLRGCWFYFFFFALYVGWPSVTIVRWYRCVDMESSFLWKFGLTTSVTFELVKTRLVGLEKQRHIFTLIWILVCNIGMVGCCCLKAPSVCYSQFDA